MAEKGSVNKDDRFYKGVISRSHKRFLEDLDPVALLDEFIEAEYLTSVQIRDIQDMQKQSDKIREILKQVRSKGVQGYKKFKQMLKKSGQKHLAEYLAELEDDLEKEISYQSIFESVNHGRTVQAQARTQTEHQRIPDDRELLSIAEHVGGNWEILGAFLGIRETRIDHIKLDYPTTPMRIFKMLIEWRNINGDEATVENLYSKMQSAPSYVNIDWEALRENSGKFGTIDSQMPDTDGNIQQMPDESEVTNDMQQLSLDQPSIYGGNSSGYSKASQQEMKQAFPFQVASNIGVFGNTRKQGVYESNEFSPDLSGGSNFSNNVSDSLPQRTPGPIQVPRRDVPGMDQLDAVQLQDTQKAAVPQHNVNFVPPDSIISQAGISARNDRLEKIFKSEHDIKGRLKILTAQNIEDLLDSCGSQPMFSGGFGDIYVSKWKIPGLNRKIVVKKVDLKKEEAELKMRSLTSEKLCARSVHFAIVPLYGIREDSENRIFYFLSPYMENGSLNQVIEDDNKRLDRPVLHPGLRVRILFQIASAIDFLHTPLKDIRGIIIHGDIKSLNIVLDEAYNARLIDFGLAREMKEGHDHTKTTSRYVFTPGYGKMTRQDILAKHDDYRYFGVVIRELLTGRKPSVEGCPEEELIYQVPKRIEKRLLGMWKKLEIKPPVGQSLVELSTKCIKDETVSSKEIVMTLKEVLKKTNTPRWGNLNEADNLPKKCDMCLENDSVEERILTHYNCQNNMNICVSCMRNSYCNPIHCHSCEKADSIDTTIYPTIGHGWAALLIAGDDSRDWVAKSLKADVDAVFKVITSKCPLVMGVSVENVQIVNPVEGVKEKMKDVVKALQKVEDIQTLLVYISSHYVPEKGGFELKSKPEKEFLSILELQEIIADILQGENQRTIVLLDCCSSPAITIAQIPVQDGKNIPTDKEPQAEEDDTNTSETSNKTVQELIVKVPGIRIVQLNACRSDQNAIVEQGGSLFRKILLQSLTRNALDEPCVNFPKCKSCSLSGDFVTVEKMQTHIASHWDAKCECVSNYYNVDHIDVKIGYVINFKVDLQVTYRYRDKVEHDRIPQRMFGELSELQIVLFDKYVEKMGLDMPADGETADGEPRLSTTDFYNILCIEIEKGPKKHQRDRLNTLERVMAAWNAKRELVVTLRTLPEVTDGAVGIFLPSDLSVKPILDILQKDKSIRCVEEDHATKYVIKLDDKLNDFRSFWEKLEKQKREQHSPSVETFDEHSVDLEEALDKLDKLEKKLLKELQIVFPCTNVDGTRNHRQNFLCYQIVRREDG